MHERKKGLIVLIGSAVAAGIFLGVTRSGHDTNTKPSTSSASASAASEPAIAPPRAAEKAEIETTIGMLENAVRTGAGDPQNPWALAHGLVAFGKDFRATDGRLAIDVIASFAEPSETGVHLARRNSLSVTDRQKLFSFPEKKSGKPLEPHRFLFVKTLLEIGVPLDRKFTVSTGEAITLGRLLDDLHRAAQLPKTDADYHQVAWLLSAMVEHASRDARAATGVHVARRNSLSVTAEPGPDLRTLGVSALDRLEADQRAVSDYTGPPEHAFDEGTPLNTAKRDKTGIYGHSCGGLHLVQAVIAFVASAGDESLKSRLRKQLGVLVYRYDLERPAYASLLARHPEQGLLIRVQQLKFHGHLVETLTLARSLGLTDPESEGGKRIDQIIRQAAHDVAEVTRELDRGAVYLRLPEIRKDREQTYLDLIGDGCHAIRGLRRAIAIY